MCGRVSQKNRNEYYIKVFGYVDEFDEKPGRNIKPTQIVPFVARLPHGEIKTVTGKWWCQIDGSREFLSKYTTFNARVDRLDNSQMWSQLLRKGNRCVFPVDSFYEWPIKGKGLPPVEIFLKGREPYGLAGLWSTWYEKGEPRYSFAVFTTEPNEFMKPIHSKAMPVILGNPEDQKRWLMDGDRDLLVPYHGELEFEQLPDTLEHLFPDED
ncbi:MAG: SOS response-associated peptidase [Pyrinomonadaceae bacterium]